MSKNKTCKDCWHNYHCPMPQEGYDYDPDICPWISEFFEENND